MTQTYLVVFFFALLVFAMLMVLVNDFCGRHRHFFLPKTALQDNEHRFSPQLLDDEPERRIRHVVETDLVCQLGVLPCGSLTQDE